MSSRENPFEAYDIDPRDGARAITERFRELLEDAHSDEERERLRTAWEELTLHPAQRVRAALGAHPRTAPPSLSAPPPQPSFGGGGSRNGSIVVPPPVTPFRDDPILFPRKK
ncbi:hypothetical protein LVJ94_37345 [Pendulispora rubella]|uniref:J domain-containing protein n=1 Tax=Pendulispora rubella TaxID=2741070 RepID=A0ABZ2KVC2_9BACT